MRFDDSLTTVLSADASAGFGAAATWRQLVDLMGRGRIAADEPAIARLRLLRQAVPVAVRAASARALAFARPGAALVGLFAEDDLAVAAPVLRTAILPAEDWTRLLGRLSPPLRSVLRHRRDLSPVVMRALESFGSVDFVIEGSPAPSPAPAPAATPAPPAAADPAPTPVPPPVPVLAPTPLPDAPLSETPFVALGEVARALPVVAEARRRTAESPLSPAHSSQAHSSRAEPSPAPFVPAPLTPASSSGYAISDLVARIEAYTRNRAEPDAAPSRPVQPGPVQPARSFRYQTDAHGVVRSVEGVGRAALVGLCFAVGGAQGPALVDAGVAGAFRRRSRFTDARLTVAGNGEAAGDWRLSGTPLFDDESGRFTGYGGTARRPRADESAAPGTASADSLRQLVHELRTPTNAIAGFAELIESELLGPVPPTYRDRAGTIRAHAADLIAAIEDLDTAARIEASALDLRAGTVDVYGLVERALADLAPLAALRGVIPKLAPDRPSGPAAADDRAAERLVGRLLSAVLSAGAAGEVIGISVGDLDGTVALTIDRPRGLALGNAANDTLMTLDEGDGEQPGAPLLGTGFALRLARNLADELGGGLAIAADRLTLRLPAALDREVGQTTIL